MSSTLQIRFRRSILCCSVVLVLAVLSVSAFAADPVAPGGDPAQPVGALAKFHQQLSERKGPLLADLASDDPDKSDKAIADIDDWAKGAIPSCRAEIFELLVESKHYDQAEESAVKYILKTPANNWSVEHLQKLRAQSFLKQGKTKEALAAAKVYYDVCRFTETKDAISLVSLCLDAAHPEDKTMAKRFKDQQAAWAATTQPTDPATTNPATTALGEPILASIEPEPSPFEAANPDKLDPATYLGFVGKGNLFLLTGKPADAKDAFDHAYEMATDKQMTSAIENVARAIRAENGNLAAANDYLALVQKK